jgi:hypothetical protein
VSTLRLWLALSNAKLSVLAGLSAELIGFTLNDVRHYWARWAGDAVARLMASWVDHAPRTMKKLWHNFFVSH